MMNKTITMNGSVMGSCITDISDVSQNCQDAAYVNSAIKDATISRLSERKQTIAQHFAKAANYDKHAHIQQRICQKLIDKMASKKQQHVLEIGAGSGQLTRLLATHIDSNQWTINELCASHKSVLQTILPQAKVIIGDAESLDFTTPATKYSLVTSANAIQWFDNPLRFVEQASSLLQSDGQLLLNTFTPDNFHQIKTLTGQGLIYPSIADWQVELAKKGFKDIQLSTHRYDVKFSSPYSVLKHMKLTGVSTNQTDSSKSKTRFLWTKTRLKQFEADYWQQFSSYDDKGNRCVSLTYDALIISAFKVN